MVGAFKDSDGDDSAGTGAAEGPAATVNADSLALTYLKYHCVFCDEQGKGTQSRSQWRAMQMCHVCYRVCTSGWRTVPPRDLRVQMTNDPASKTKFMAARREWVDRRSSGVSRARVPPASVL